MPCILTYHTSRYHNLTDSKSTCTSIVLTRSMPQCKHTNIICITNHTSISIGIARRNLNTCPSWALSHLDRASPGVHLISHLILDWHAKRGSHTCIPCTKHATYHTSWHAVPSSNNISPTHCGIHQGIQVSLYTFTSLTYKSCHGMAFIHREDSHSTSHNNNNNHYSFLHTHIHERKHHFLPHHASF